MDDGCGSDSGGSAPADDDHDGALLPPQDAANAAATTTNTNNKREREPTMHWADTGFAGYMQAKIRKLEEQHRSNQAVQPALSAVFRGVSIHVNGLTMPSHAVREAGMGSGTEGGREGGRLLLLFERAPHSFFWVRCCCGNKKD